MFILGLEDGSMPLVFGDMCDEEEEARLMYVAMTRAKERLILTHARKRLFRFDQFPSKYICSLTQVSMTTPELDSADND